MPESPVVFYVTLIGFDKAVFSNYSANSVTDKCLAKYQMTEDFLQVYYILVTERL